jgi:hypothetical protein
MIAMPLYARVQPEASLKYKGRPQGRGSWFVRGLVKMQIGQHAGFVS